MTQPAAGSVLWHVAKQELYITLKTRRAFAAAGLYVASALMGSFTYIYSLREIEKTLTALLVREGADPLSAASTVGLMSSDAYEKTLSFFVGHDLDLIAEIFRTSPLLPVCLWGSLAFLPFLILMTSFDQTVNDINSRSICYSLLRISRFSVVLGKVLAHTILFMGLTAICSGILISVAASQLENLDLAPTIQGFVRIWLMLLPFGLCYLSITSFASTLAKTPFGAMSLSIALVFLLKLFEWFKDIPSSSTYSFLQNLRWLSPSTYTAGLWLKDPIEPLISCAAYTCIAAGFLFLGTKRLEARDL